MRHVRGRRCNSTIPKRSKPKNFSDRRERAQVFHRHTILLHMSANVFFFFFFISSSSLFFCSFLLFTTNVTRYIMAHSMAVATMYFNKLLL